MVSAYAFFPPNPKSYQFQELTKKDLEEELLEEMGRENAIKYNEDLKMYKLILIG